MWAPSSGPGSASLNPALSLGSDLELFTDFLGRPLGSALDRGPARDLPFRLRRAADDETDRVSARREHGDRDRHTGHLAARRVDDARSESLQTVFRHQIAFDHRL